MQRKLHTVFLAIARKETSLRLQRKLKCSLDHSVLLGNISAPAEKTTAGLRRPSGSRKHLCACREDLGRDLKLRGHSGNISAHAEKTTSEPEMQYGSEKHLCACREDTYSYRSSLMRRETSLRMQRRRGVHKEDGTIVGNISAHAEKTLMIRSGWQMAQKHLCACREDSCYSFWR